MKPIRVQLSRRKGWRMPANTVSVARPTKYGNPHSVGYCYECRVDHTREEAVAKFRALLSEFVPSQFAELRGKNLACWCKLGKLGEPCHADVLLEIANAP